MNERCRSSGWSRPGWPMRRGCPASSEQQLVEQIITATAQQRPRPRWLALLQGVLR